MTQPVPPVVCSVIDLLAIVHLVWRTLIFGGAVDQQKMYHDGPETIYIML